MDEVAALVRKALAAEDLSAVAELLDPAVTWGAPGARNPSCKNRNQGECARYRECQGAWWSSPSVSGALSSFG